MKDYKVVVLDANARVVQREGVTTTASAWEVAAIAFTFSGKRLRSHIIQVYDYDTNTLIEAVDYASIMGE